MTHVDNLPHIILHGITHSNSLKANPDYKPIGDFSVIQSRKDFTLENGKNLGDYIPFYFGTRTPMLFVVQKGFNMVHPIEADKIVYCVSSVQQILKLKLEFFFTDGHALDRFSSQYTIDDIARIGNVIDWKAVKEKYWNNENDLDLK